MSALAPIAFFAYKRPLTALQSLWSLSRCAQAAESKLYIFCDGARSATDAEGVRLTREVVRLQRWCGEIEIVESPVNKGLARSIIDGVTQLCGSHGKVIVVEDDLILSSGFLGFLNAGLDRYRESPRVMSVTGHTVQPAGAADGSVFMPGGDSHGWGTWARAWALFEEFPSGVEALQGRDVRRRFDDDGTYPFADMLDQQMAGRLDSWAIRFRWSIFKHDGLSLFPTRTLVQNIGDGPDATHTNSGRELRAASWSFGNRVTSFPGEVRLDTAAYQSCKRELSRMQGSRPRRILESLGDVVYPFASLDTRRRHARDLLRAVRGW